MPNLGLGLSYLAAFGFAAVAASDVAQFGGRRRSSPPVAAMEAWERANTRYEMSGPVSATVWLMEAQLALLSRTSAGSRVGSLRVSLDAGA